MPLVLLFNTIGLDPVVALAGMCVIWPLGDAIPPTAIIGRLTASTVGMKEPYSRLLRACLVPAAIIALVDPDGRLQQKAGLFGGVLTWRRS